MTGNNHQPGPAAFYRAFEDVYRGSAETIRERLRVYLPGVQSLESGDSPLRVLDIGCGRGEWLSLLHESSIEALGVDLDEHMLSACREQGLAVECADGIDFLEQQGDASWNAITAFHVVEHLAFADLQRLVAAARRALVPGGLLILETPNPENVHVAGCSFYMDPTHQRPLPPALLGFLLEHAGFPHVRPVRLDRTGTDQPDGLSLEGVLLGVSADYGLIACTPGDGHTPAPLDAGREGHYGLSLERAVRRFDQRLEQARAQADAAERRLAAHEREFERVRGQLQVVFASRSKRITAPLRALGALRGLRALGRGVRAVARRAVAFVLHRPRLALSINRLLRRWPRLHEYATGVARRALDGCAHDRGPSHGDVPGDLGCAAESIRVRLAAGDRPGGGGDPG